jgi:hypothetical protein
LSNWTGWAAPNEVADTLALTAVGVLWVLAFAGLVTALLARIARFPRSA